MKILVIVLALLSTGCTRQGALDVIVTPQEQALAVKVADELRVGDVAALAQSADPAIRPDLPMLVDRVTPFLAKVEGSFTVTGAFARRSLRPPGSSIKTILLQAGANDRWAVAEVVLRRDAGGTSLVGLRVVPFDRDPESQGAFDVTAQGLPGYAVLAMMLACAATCVWAIVLIWRRPWLRRRWLWTIGSLCGFAGFALNWTTGEWSFAIMKMTLLGIQIVRPGPYAPFYLGFGLPIVAVVVVYRWYAGPGRGEDAPI